MSISQKRKNQIIDYMLTKLEMHDNVVKKTSEYFKISNTTIYRYLRELKEENIIEQVSKGKYKIINEEYDFKFTNQNIEEDNIYFNEIQPLIKEFPNNVKKIWAYAFTEIMNNAIEHSESKKITCGLFKNYINTTCIISDQGIGIFNKIKEYYKYSTLDDAILELFKGKLTTDKENHSGEGIFFTSRLMDTFMVISSGKIFTHDNHYELLEDLNEKSQLGELLEGKGTVVFMQLANKTHKELKEVFDLFADVDKGFNKTKIPIKNMFGNEFPVSRSQARRLYNGFEKFEEITLDFEGVDEIGQAFADELFGKFEKKHRNIVLLVENANENVDAMIKHAKNTKI